MKLTILIAMMLCSVISISMAYDHVIETGDNFEGLTLDNYDTLTMTGGEGHYLHLFDHSEATIEDTDPLVSEGNGGIWMIGAMGYSSVDFSGGEVHQFDIVSYATATFSGGSIDEIWSYQVVDDVWVEGTDPPEYVPDPHIEMICRDWSYNETSRYLAGTWEDFSTFDIYLSDYPETQHGYDPAIENFSFTIIPEPSMLLLLGLGAIMVRKKR